MARGLDRLEEWEPVDLDAVAARLSLRRLTPEDLMEIERDARQAIRKAKTARAMGKALGGLLNAVAARYGA